MTDINIDALAGDELKKQAKILNIPLTGNPKEETIRERIRDALGEPAPAAPKAPIVSGAGKADKEKKVRILIQESELDKQPVFLGLNGRIIRIQRGKEVDVPAGYVDILKNAVQVIRDPKTNEDRKVLSYPFQVIQA